jgi:4-amino-4-deoxy-L-arabinose transferase-like glycosyltransferase
MTNRSYWTWLAAVVVLAAVLRGLFPTADPPWRSTVGVVWHDEGAWTHNARNKALYGHWVQDAWNPVYIAPVFTGLEYLSFDAFGVGLRQARLVSEVFGVLSVVLLALGVRRIAGNAAGLYAGALAATNYVYVMYDRAAIMEGLMAACIVGSWFCSTRAERRPIWGAAAAVMAALAFFTKAAAAFYVASLGLVSILALVASQPRDGDRGEPDSNHRAAAAWALAGLVVSFGLAAALFVLPHWADYQFYNWQVSVTRKPSYDMASLLQRVTWFPVLHDTFSRSWPELLLALLGAWQIASRWRGARDAERLLLLWVAMGSLEMLVHDVGNERRFVFLLPALAAFTGIALAARAFEFHRPSTLVGWLAQPLVFYSCYVVTAPLVRLLFLGAVHDHRLRETVRISAVGALLAGSLTMFVLRKQGAASLFMRRWGAAALFVLLLGWDLFQFAGWAHGRTYKNYAAMLALRTSVPPETPIQGKLANGLALENRIRPIFIGHGFGNYVDRTQRADVRYILTYTSPWLGYEGSQIVDVLDASPGWRIIMKFDVAESSSGHDTAVLIDKRARD